jgi:RNA polymerase sigma factor (sigma-70 family)
LDEIKEVKRAIKGNVASFERLITEHKGTMYRVARTILPRDEDCADAIQEAILKAFRGMRTLREPRYFKTWLVRILLNECQQIHRQRKKLVSMEEYADPSIREKGFEQIEVHELLDALPDDQKHILKLFYIEDLSIHDLALILDIPENTVKTRLRRARENMQQLIAKDEEVETWKNGKRN